MAVAAGSVPSVALRPDVSLFRLYLLRATYALIAIGMGMQVWPGIFHHDKLELTHGVVRSMLAGMTALMLLGLRYPLKMLPLLFFEFAWKFIWLASFALPLYLGHQMDPDVWDTVQACALGVVIVPIAIPWRYVFQNYVKQRGDRWR
ncbi:MAG: hypothetical protein JO092_05375 [Candidatus Eremiobacteraeota bacterium]|nr:hypothetical protein [Candidatus Eremiobacteraeota bacterium]MBV8375213.1 hypothetical protein [Candidatus Eremiobacteraeota bacterium]